MSAIIGRLIISVGAGLVAAVFYTIWKDRNQHQHQTGGGRPPPGSFYAPSVDAWDDTASEHEPDGTRRRGRGRTNDCDNISSVSSGTSVQSSCPVCYERFKTLKSDEIPIMSTPCGHLFCEPCVTESLRRTSTCPTCRKRISLSACHPIYI